MKKVIILVILILLTGCGKDKYTTCTIDFNNTTLNYSMSAEYKIYSKKGFVTKIIKNEEYSSKDKETINYLKELKEIEYSNLSDIYGGYTYNIKDAKDKVEVDAKVILKEVDIKKMVKLEYLDKYYVNKGKLSLGGIKEFYISKGANCN